MKRLGAIIGIIAVLLILFFVFSTSDKRKPVSSTPVKNTASLISLQTGPVPWNTEVDTLKDRLAAINLPALNTEGSTLHTHQHLDIFIEGKNIPIPQDIGVNESAGYISPIHTHDGSGIIHVESPTVQKFTLGQFFNVWGVRFNNQCLGGYCEQNDKKLSVFINGQIQSDNYADITLEPRQEIVISYGTEKEIPQPIPSSYTFPPEDN